MPLKLKIVICLICLVIGEKIGGMHPGVCAAPASEEVLWISLDVSPEERKKIDGIIFDAYKQVKIGQKNIKAAHLENPNEYLKLLSYLQQMGETRQNINRDIRQLLSPQQRRILETQLEQIDQSKQQFAGILMMLDLSREQQAKIVAALLKNQKKVWTIISRRSLSWEKRRKQLGRIDKIKEISLHLSRQQQEKFSYMLGMVYLQKSNEGLFLGLTRPGVS
ncbi:hypothetical protein [Acetonema longum]|uniref:Uncharacterized protein n=1 Tax=Acetonema longum DSM 6540 TaxID=1009370 RepID=F7NP20_9FIRM|nr:hypothetical protein [Acetonema longum]EGO62143.1 hypothetical protein ALO_19307 [Acetonema longum DSM 6540]